jgi:hypothetical protein
MKNKKFFIVTGIIAVLLVGGYIMYQESKKNKLASDQGESSDDGTGFTSGSSEKAKSGSQAKIITNFDSVWDYKLENGAWYTKKKTSSTWLDMKNVASDYNKAVAKLTDFMNK